LFSQGLKARSIQAFLPIPIGRAFSPFENGNILPGATLRLPQATIKSRRWRFNCGFQVDWNLEKYPV
jgi:hypothetical protein